MTHEKINPANLSNNKIKIVVIDDEQPTLKGIIHILRSGMPDVEIAGEAVSVEAGVKAIQANRPDLVLLDINLGNGDGFELLKKVGDIDFKVIFITAYQEYAVKAFEFSAIDYLLKPIDPEKLIQAIRKTQMVIHSKHLDLKLKALYQNMELKDHRTKKLVLKTAENIYLIDTGDIIRCESDGSYTKFFLSNGKKIMVSRHLKEFEDILTGFGFYRIHQSHLINFNHVDLIQKSGGGAVIMKDNSAIPVSRRKKEELMKLIENI
jgi:two-component system, LytTR family, response regulator